jgi:7-carboxy-7-deazaguanine synthase
LTGVLTAPLLDAFVSRQGEGICVGDAQVFLRFGGCNLVCDYCDTPDSIPIHSGKALTLSQVLEKVDGFLNAKPGVISLTGGEPLLQVRFLEQLIPQLRQRGHRIYLETNGSLPKALEHVIDGCDWVSMDFKPQSAIGRDLWEAHRWFLTTGGQKIFVKLVLTATTTDAEVEQAIALLACVNSAIPLILQPATPWGKAQSVPMAKLDRWRAQASHRLSDVRVLPQVHRLWGIP